MARTMEELDQEKQDLIRKFWDADNNSWKAATEEERKGLQRQLRELKNEIRFIKEEDTLTDPDILLEIKEMLFPLVERRKIPPATFSELIFSVHPRIFNSPDGPLILTTDGELFCFEPETSLEVTEETCGCGAYPVGWQPTNNKEEAEVIVHMKVCSNVVKTKIGEPVARIKHSRGDWDCRGCLNTEKTPSAPAGLAQLALIKWLEWCPNFPKWARAQSLEETIRIENKARHMEQNLEGSSEDELKCYAGLMHSQIEWGERENEVSSDDPNRTRVVQHIKIVRMCDTCGYREEEEKTSTWENTEVEIPVESLEPS